MNLNDIQVNPTIADGDGMAKGRPEVYLRTGKNALQMVMQSLKAAYIDPTNVTRILDYACGYGRVLRWLDAGFPEAELTGVDVDGKAVASAAQVLGVTTEVLDPSLTNRLGGPFDLVWVGSLFTHLKEQEMLRVMQYLRSHLCPKGVIVFTTHGYHVSRRLRQREKTYNLDEANVVQLLDQFDSGNFAFSPYAYSEDYGISLSSPNQVVSLLDAAGLAPVFYRARGWANHQDVFGCQPILE